jgi:hypothetical protein
MYSQLTLIKKLTDLGERQLGQEIKASKLLMSELEKFKVKYKIQYFQTKIPLIKSATLTADRRKIQALGCSMVSGVIKNKFKLTTPLFKPLKKDVVNINYNPKCEAISRNTFYFAPSLAINKRDVSRIKKARYVEGEIKVQAQKHRSLNILIGNLKNPKNILFAHYDSIGPGAFDDASGIAVLLRLIIDYPKLEKDCLFVLAGNEELSYDTPNYWGRGYRAFEKKYYHLLKGAKRIIVADGVGAGVLQISKDLESARDCFPIKNLKKLRSKIVLLHNNKEVLYKIYHSDLDIASNIKAIYLQQANRKILKLLD